MITGSILTQTIKIHLLLSVLAPAAFPDPSPLISQPLPAVTVRGTAPLTGAVVILPVPNANEVYAVGNLTLGQTGLVFAVSSDGHKIWVHISTNGITGVIECKMPPVGRGNRFEVRSESGKLIEQC